MELKKIHEILSRVGLTDYETKVYTTLLLTGPSKAGPLSRESQVPQSKIYTVLNQLMEKNLVEIFEAKPKEFKAVAPEIALLSMLDEKLREIQELKKEIKRLSKILKPKFLQEFSSGIWTARGKKWTEYFNKLSELLLKCRNYCFVVTKEFSISSRLSEAIKQCRRKGVNMKFIGITSPSSELYARIRWYLENGVEVKFADLKVHPRILLVDGKEVLVRLDGSPSSRDEFYYYTFWSDDPSLVNVLDTYLKNLWEESQPLDLKSLSANF